MLELSLPGVYLARLECHGDARGSLTELYRSDTLPPGASLPVMSYVSVTEPGQVRGPHEHQAQTDLFAFPGPGLFRIRLWDNRPDSPACGQTLTLELGEGHPGLLLVPPGVVHGYANVSAVAGLVVNFPDRLYRGADRRGAVDEIRYEDIAGAPFRMEE